MSAYSVDLSVYKDAELEMMLVDLNEKVLMSVTLSPYEKAYHKISGELMARMYPEPSSACGVGLVGPELVAVEAPLEWKPAVGRLYNRRTMEDDCFTTRMVMFPLAERLNGYDVHVSIFPDSHRDDQWNRAYNENLINFESSEAQKRATLRAGGDISCISNMNFSCFHVSFGHGTRTVQRFFFGMDGVMADAGVDVSQENKKAANRIANAFVVWLSGD